METLTKAPARISKLGTPAIVNKLKANLFEGDQKVEALAVLIKRGVDVSEFNEVSQQAIVQVAESLTPVETKEEKEPSTDDSSKEPKESKSDKIKRMLKAGKTPSEVKKELIAAGIGVHYSEVHRIKTILDNIRKPKA